jgi:DNA-binding beta-propeller fold protein YncE
MRLLVMVQVLIVMASSAARADLLVSSRLSNKVLRYNDAQEFVGEFAVGGNLVTPNGLAMGADGFLYVASRDGGQVLRYNGATGQFHDVFASGPEMVGPSGLTFGPDSDLYVANSLADNVSRYDRTTGALVSSFGLPGSLSAPIGVGFDNLGLLYVTSALNNRLLRYDRTTGAEELLASGGLLANPCDITRGADGKIYFANALGRVARFDPATGGLSAFSANFAVQNPVAVAFGPGGDLYVAAFASDTIVRLNGLNGTSKGAYISQGLGGLDGPQYILFVPEPGVGFVFLAAILLRIAGRSRRP